MIGELLLPHHLAGVLVQRHHRGVEGAEEHLVAIDRGAAVDHVAARADVVGQAVVVGPQALAGLRIEGEQPRVGGGHVDHAVADDGLGLLAALFLVAEGVRPGRGQLEHVVGVDLLERAPALGVGAHAVLQHVAGGLVVVGDVLPGHILGQRGASAAQGDGEGEAVQARAQEAGRGG